MMNNINRLTRDFIFAAKSQLVFGSNNAYYLHYLVALNNG